MQTQLRSVPGLVLPELGDLVPVWDEVGSPEVGTITWLQPLDFRTSSFNNSNLTPLRFRYFYSGPNGIKEECTQGFSNPWRCYCTAKQLPRVEYSVCASSSNNSYRTAATIEACCQQKVSEGLLPLGGTAESDHTVSQAFWRWAD